MEHKVPLNQLLVAVLGLSSILLFSAELSYGDYKLKKQKVNNTTVCGFSLPTVEWEDVPPPNSNEFESFVIAVVLPNGYHIPIESTALPTDMKLKVSPGIMKGLRSFTGIYIKLTFSGYTRVWDKCKMP
ncbi:hypothetical protein [Nitrospira sp. M1]